MKPNPHTMPTSTGLLADVERKSAPIKADSRKSFTPPLPSEQLHRTTYEPNFKESR